VLICDLTVLLLCRKHLENALLHSSQMQHLGRLSVIVRYVLCYVAGAAGPAAAAAGAAGAAGAAAVAAAAAVVT